MAKEQVEAYRKIANNLAEIERLMEECRTIAYDTGVVFAYPASIIEALKDQQNQNTWKSSDCYEMGDSGDYTWQASELC